MTVSEMLLERQSARLARARELSARSDAALAKADEAKALLTLSRNFPAAEYPQLHANLLADWQYNVSEARRLHDEAMGEFLRGSLG